MKYTAIISTDEPLTEDIIQDLKDTMFFGDDPAYALEIEDIKLEQEPTTKNDLRVDCVARQDVERYIEGFINEYTPEEELEFINLELDGLKHLPPATPQEPRRGHWIDTHDNAFVHFRVYKCSYCGAIFCDYPKNLKKYKYCSDCGCRMVEPQESEEQTEGK